MSTSKQKHYRAPALVVHGDVEAITREANLENADTPEGVPDTATVRPPSGGTG
jgi:hypothetical protein